MKNFIEGIQENFPWTTVNKYWDHYEVFVKKDSNKWWTKFSWTEEVVKKNIELIINFQEQWKKNLEMQN